MIWVIFLVIGGGSLFTEPRANRVGDLVTVIITESSYAKNRVETRTDKSEDISVGASQSGIPGLPASIGNSISAGVSLDNEHDGKGKNLREGKFEAYVTAKVVEVLENGNLKIAGEKKVHISQDDMIIKVAGIVRPEDIGANNQVLSISLADANIEYKGKGVVEGGHRKGFISRLLDWLF